MPENQETLTADLDAAFADPTPEEIGAQDPAPVGNEGGKPEGSVDNPAPTQGNEVDTLKREYAAVQKAYADGRIEFYQLKAEMKKLQEQLLEAKKAPVKEEDSDDAKTLADFIQGPNKTLDSRIDRKLSAVEQKLLKELEEMKTWRASQTRDQQIDAFLSQHPEITTEDEHELARIMDQNPWIKQLSDAGTKLNVAFSMLVAKDPKAWSLRGEKPKPDASLSAAKAGASAIGAKGGSKVVVPKDEFDEVLEEDRKSSALWR